MYREMVQHPIIEVEQGTPTPIASTLIRADN